MTTVEINTMKMSNTTLEYLKNYSTINSNIIIEPGNTLKTLSPVKNVMSECTISETFEQTIAIWDLNKFLGTVSLFDNPTFEFHENHVVISDEGKSAKTKYHYAEPELIQSVTQTINMPDPVVDFRLTEGNLNQIMKAASVLQLPDLCVRNESGTLELVALDSKDSSCNTYSVNLGDVDEDAPAFDFFFKTENMKMLPGDYDVEITSKLVSKFTSVNNDLSYWIALENNSNYEG
tara:strand:+ start:333 stop:1034 length:702 start_codon:yes stop_codon:yes gene_type:complete